MKRSRNKRDANRDDGSGYFAWLTSDFKPADAATADILKLVDDDGTVTFIRPSDAARSQFPGANK